MSSATVVPRSLTEVGGHDLRVAHHVLRRTVRQQPPEVQHDDALGEAEHRLHHVLDPDHGDAESIAGSAHDVDRGVQLGVVEPGHHLVEQEQPRPAGQRPGEVEEALLVEVERADVVVAARVEVDEPERLLGAGVRLRLAGPATDRTEHGAEHHVLAHRHLAERPRRLQDHGDPRLAGTVRRQASHVGAGEADRPTGRRGEPADRLQQRALAGAVRADEGENLTLVDLQRDATDGGKTAEGLLDGIELEDRGQGSYGSSGSATISVSGYHSPASLTPSGAGPGPITENSGVAAAISPHSVQLRSQA